MIERPATLTQLLRQRDFGLYFLGNLVSNTGNWVKDIATAIFIFQLTGSATMVAGVAVTGYSTSLVLAPLGGSLADRYDRKLVLAAAHLIQMIAAGALSAAVFAGLRSPWIVLAASAVIGVGKALITPTLHAILPGVVDRNDLGPALTLQSITFNGTRAIGPIIGAAVITQFGPAVAFAINAGAFALLPILLPFIRVAPRDSIPEGTEVGAGGIRESVRIAVADRRLIVLILMMGVVGMGTDPVLTLGPSLAVTFGAEAAFAGTLVSAFGVGSVLVAPFINTIRLNLQPVRAAQAGLTTMAAGLSGLAIAPSTQVALIAAAIAGAGFLTASADLTTVLQGLVPDAVRGRIMSLWTVAYLGSRPAAALLSGTTADLVHPRVGVAVIAAIVVATAVILRRERTRHRWTGPAATEPRQESTEDR